MRKILVSMLMCGFALAGCGGGDGDDAFRPPTAGGGGGGGSATATQLTAQASVGSITSTGTQTATITAFARDANNNLVANVPVTFTANSGGLSGMTPVTNEAGVATATLSTAGDPSIRTITVTATSGNLTANVAVQVVAGSDPGQPPTVTMGCGVGANFQAGVLCVANANLSAGASTTLTATLQQSDGSLYTQNAEVSFTSTCVAQNTASLTSPVSTSTGLATTTYVARGCSGADVITATATVGGTPVSATGTVTIAPSAVGEIIYVSATPPNMALRGTGTPSNPETSTVVFQVNAAGGGVRPGATVNFSLNTTVGGITLTPTTAVSDANGRVQTVVRGGTVATAVRVTATVQNVTPTLAVQSNQLTVTTGIPDQDSFSLSVSCPNAEGWSRDNVTVDLTARLSDRFNNPVPEGTAVTFQSEGGSIDSSCTTVGVTGACSVEWRSSNPRPPMAAVTVPAGETRAGRSSILATAIGEETFADANGNGSFDNGESFEDMPERFLDLNENDNRDASISEPIYDFNNNSTYDPVDGIFNGVLCLDTSGRCSAQTTTGISASNLIIMSDTVPSLNPLATHHVTPVVGTTFTVAANGSSSFILRLVDINGNPLAGGTTVSYQMAGTGYSVSGPGNNAVPCTTEPSLHTVTIAGGNQVGPSILTVSVESPDSGVVTSFTYNVQP
jgi:Bacterial Ig-like domain (group 1)